MQKFFLPIALLIGLIGVVGAKAGEIGFTEAPVPATDSEKRSILTSSQAIVDGQAVDLDFHTILRSGDKGIMSSVIQHPYGESDVQPSS